MNKVEDVMAKEHGPEFWKLERLLRGVMFDELGGCINFVEGQIIDFDDRNDTEHQHRYGPPTQIAFVLMCVARMETGLKQICDMVRAARNYNVHWNDLTGGGGFQSCINYFDKVLQVPIPKDELSHIRSVVELRNRWVHHDGYVEKLPTNLRSVEPHVDIVDGRLVALESLAQAVCASCKSFVEVVARAVDSQPFVNLGK